MPFRCGAAAGCGAPGVTGRAAKHELAGAQPLERGRVTGAERSAQVPARVRWVEPPTPIKSEVAAEAGARGVPPRTSVACEPGAASPGVSVRTVGPRPRSWKRTSASWTEPVAACRPRRSAARACATSSGRRPAPRSPPAARGSRRARRGAARWSRRSSGAARCRSARRRRTTTPSRPARVGERDREVLRRSGRVPQRVAASARGLRGSKKFTAAPKASASKPLTSAFAGRDARRERRRPPVAATGSSHASRELEAVGVVDRRVLARAVLATQRRGGRERAALDRGRQAGDPSALGAKCDGLGVAPVEAARGRRRDRA